MKRAQLTRTYSKYATFGTLSDSHDMTPLMQTLELPWLDNQNDISCIKEGLYYVKKFVEDGKTYLYIVKDRDQELSREPGFKNWCDKKRFNVRMHTGNTVEDITGCVVVGSKFGRHMDYHAVLESRDAFKKLLTWLGKDDIFELQIVGRWVERNAVFPEIMKDSYQIPINTIPRRGPSKTEVIVETPAYIKDAIEMNEMKEKFTRFFTALYSGLKQGKGNVDNLTPRWQRIAKGILRIAEVVSKLFIVFKGG